jgi:hypothetical protein
MVGGVSPSKAGILNIKFFKSLFVFDDRILTLYRYYPSWSSSFRNSYWCRESHRCPSLCHLCTSSFRRCCYSWSYWCWYEISILLQLHTSNRHRLIINQVLN